jgi:regulator of replication initiation timing
VPAKKKKVRPSLSQQLRRNKDLVKYWYNENSKLQLSLSNARRRIEDFSKFENAFINNKDTFLVLENRCRVAESALKQIIDELVCELNADQLEVAELMKYPPERYALEWFKILKYQYTNLVQRLRDGVI